MGLLERVSTLVRANLNDLIDRAENPSKMIKQVILDMENQLLQVKTQVAISIADQHMLEKKQAESEAKAAEWLRKAELAVEKGQDDLARAALERHKSSERTSESFKQQVEDQRAQFTELIKKQQAQADKAYEIQTNVMQQQVTAEAVKVQQVEKQEQVKVQEAEIARREKELIATVLKQAEVERQRVETLAAARPRARPARPRPRSSSRRARPRRRR